MANKKIGRRTVSRKVSIGDQMLQISRLHLDSQNPRHEPLESDANVIAQLCNEELVTELAQDIATRGSLSPLDVLGVIPFDGHPGHYIAVEGNRRTCALILISDPSRAPTPALQAQLHRIAVAAKVPREVKVHVFADRKAATNHGSIFVIWGRKAALVLANGMQTKRPVLPEEMPKHRREPTPLP